MLEIPRLPPPFRDRMAEFVGEEKEHYGPATLESIADEQRRQGKQIQFIINHLTDEERMEQILAARRYPQDHVLLGMWNWFKGFSLIAAGAVIRWIFETAKK